MQPDRSYITTPIYYVNAAPHLGHAHTTTIADVLRRARMQSGIEVFFTTGTDEHGQKNFEAARSAGLQPAEYLETQSALFRNVFDRLGIEYDLFVRTTSAQHQRGVSAALTRLNDKGLFERGVYEGYYCYGCEQFKREADLVNGRCVDHPSLEIEWQSEVNYFLPLEPYREAIASHIRSKPDWIRPAQYANSMLALLEQPLEALCISRPKQRVPLGIELPFDRDYVAYVWVDALLNYLTSLGWPDRNVDDWWSVSEHLIGKDVLKTHAIYWPCILLALGEKLPDHISVHSHWVGAGGQKMSKTAGNVVDPNAVVAKYGVATLRYFLCRNMRTTSDSQASDELIGQAYSELSNRYGNLILRIAKFAQSSFGGVPVCDRIEERDGAILAEIFAKVQIAHEQLRDLEGVASGAENLLWCVNLLNDYFTTAAPWKHFKADPASNAAKSTTYIGLEAIRLITEGFLPVMPDVASNILATLGASLGGGHKAHEFRLQGLTPSVPIGEIAVPFPRLENA